VPTEFDGAMLPKASSSGPILLVASNGGHLAQLLTLRPWWERRDRVWVTFDKPDARSQLVGESVVWAHHPTTRNLKNLMRNTLLATKLLRQQRPAMVVSSGAAVAVPFFLLARLTGVPSIYIEVYDRVASRTLTGRICRPFASRFLVQWEQQQDMYAGSTVIGTLL
jgi:UDP-N-acetylglucosamine:LPS N-acetylglucosamine transferase